ncbi:MULTISPECIES: DUF397 domain-containing protein [Streptomyces]|uniref:DUF397 domain-containing protein n=1 Tax=Streptomyces TaxID=1883 RepID=UPI001D15106F|nr:MULTISPECIES: DUF397 domain-containing protein [Streptomyces]MCC3653014.1 DUF397 domain-containing protein [Streptomyces sp. S07_1.15]WSQ72355.1 DUF397 domain-containing protein [Streptomyces xinghaiensis]
MDIRWQKSSFSEQPEGNCLELAAGEAVVLMRESDAPAGVIVTTPERLRALVAGVKAGEFDTLL